MITFSRFNDLGRYTAIVSCPAECLQHENQNRIYLGEVDALTQYHDFETGKPVSKPVKPSPHHVFDYAIKQWVDPRTPEEVLNQVRTSRNALLQKSDWTQLPDVPIATKDAWAIYRQALRDITVQPDPFNIVWPVPPQ